MKVIDKKLSQQDGSVIVIALLLLVALSILALFTTRNSTTEIQISTNELQHNIAFYSADSGLELGAELLEKNIGSLGFGIEGVANPFELDANERYVASDIGIKVKTASFYSNAWGDVQEPAEINDPADPDYPGRDVFFPAECPTDCPHTNLTYGGKSVAAEGASLIMAAGYEGKGKSVASGGGHLLYKIYAQNKSGANAGSRMYRESMVLIEYRHVIGQED